MIPCFTIPCCILWFRIYLYICLYCVILIIIILVRFMQPPCMLNVVQFTVCLLAHLHCVCLAKLWSTERPRKFGWRARDLKSTGRTLSEFVLLSCVVIVLRHIVELFCKSTAERERCCSTSDIFSERIVPTWTLLLIIGHLLEACCIVVDAGVQRGPSARRFQEYREASTEAARSHRLIWSGRIVSSDLGCWTRTRRRNSSSRYLSSLVVEVRVCRSTPEDR